MLTDDFYDYLKKRDSIRIRRAYGLPREQWTDDPILQKYKFTNVRRQDDWTTRMLVDRFYDRDATDQNKFLNCVLGRFFGQFETLQDLGFQYDPADIPTNVRDMVARRQAARKSVFTGSYIVPNCGSDLPKHEVVIRIVDECRTWFRKVRDDIWGVTPMQDVVKSLVRNVNGMGSFMAKEVLLDVKLMTSWQPSDWSTWTPMGPGARRGAARVAGDGTLLSPLSEAKALAVAQQLYESRTSLWPSLFVFDHADGIRTTERVPDLELCDIQFALCEYDKMWRVRQGGRAKTLFRPRK